jgi:hypothetical protein
MPIIEPGQKRATLLVSRDAQFFGAGVVYTILFDGRPIRNLASGQEFRVEVPTGIHVVGLVCGSTGIFGASDETTVPFEDGHLYKLRAFTTINTPCQVQFQGVDAAAERFPRVSQVSSAAALASAPGGRRAGRRTASSADRPRRCRDA